MPIISKEIAIPIDEKNLVNNKPMQRKTIEAKKYIFLISSFFFIDSIKALYNTFKVVNIIVIEKILSVVESVGLV